MKTIRRILGLSVILVVIGSVSRCSNDGTRIPVFGDEPEVTPTQLPCEALVRLTGYDYSINSAMLISASDESPEYCQVRGQILPEVAFELRLPTRWNRRFLMFGNAGLAGVIHVWDLDGAAKQYSAVASTNTGHRAPPSWEHAARFATDRQKLIDYAYRAVHVTVLTAKEIISSYYNAPLAYAYFSGCSTGGRQGLVSAQRFADDFDGILVGAPVLDVSQVVSDAWIQKALRNAPADLHLLADRVYAACDSVDGLTDGLIDDPRRCQFEPSRDLPVCGTAAAGSGCYTDEQVQALAGSYEDVVAGGERLAPGYPVGSEIFVKWAPQREASGWLGWRVGVDKPFGVAITETILRYLAFEYSLSTSTKTRHEWPGSGPCSMRRVPTSATSGTVAASCSCTSDGPTRP
jgi:feruloyl esterase